MTAAKGKTVTVRQIKSGIGFQHKQNATLKAMGLGRIGKTRQMPDNPQSRGMIARVSHLVQVDEQARTDS